MACFSSAADEVVTSYFTRFFLASVLLCSFTYSQTVVDKVFVTNAPVTTVVSRGTTVYIGGRFSYVGPLTGAGAVIDTSTGAYDAAFPRVTGTVHAVVPDGSGGWYVGGSFTSIGGVSLSNVGHIRSDTTVDAGWNPNANSVVNALAAIASTVYVGGDFTNIGGQPRNRIAAFDATTGNVTNWNPGADFVVDALAVSGSAVYVGGSFLRIGGQPRNRIAAFDVITGALTDWNPNANNAVRALAVSGSTVYAGGLFTGMGGQTRRYLAAIDATTGSATGWDPDANSPARTIAVSDSIVYVGGQFRTIGGQPRNYLAAIDATTGSVTGWDPNVSGVFVGALAVQASTVYVGGEFTGIGGQVRNNIAAVDAITGTATSWDPNANSIVYALAASGSTVYTGGSFTSIGGRTRNYLAAFNATTGNVTSWDPRADGAVHALAVLGSNVYVGGRFTRIGGQMRNNIAILDTTAGAATEWDPIANGAVNALAVEDSTVYIGGEFFSIGNRTRSGLAAFDATTGNVTSWDPRADGSVYALEVNGSTVYAGGLFTNIGGQARNNLAALDAATGNATSWNPNADNIVRALAVSGSIIYAGGLFAQIGGQWRNGIAALDVTTGNGTNWNPDANGSVNALAVLGPNVYVGGYFTNIGGQERNHLAAIDEMEGSATNWNPNVDRGVSALDIDFSNARIHAGGESFLVALTLSSALPPRVLSSTPPSNATGIDTNTVISVTFTRVMNKSTTESNVYLADSTGLHLAGAFLWTNGDRTLTFSPDASLLYYALYRFVIRGEAIDVDRRLFDGNGDGTGGDSLAVSFRTRPFDVTAPAIASIFPKENGVFIGVATVINVTFDERVNVVNLTDMNIELAEVGGALIPKTLQIWDTPGRTGVNIYPTQAFGNGKTYRVTLRNISDTWGNVLGSPISRGFSVGNQGFEFITIDDFNTTSPLWKQPALDTFTVGFIYDSTNIFRNLSSTYLIPTLQLNTSSFRLRYGWDINNPPWLISMMASDFVKLPQWIPLGARLQLYMLGDGSRNLFRYVVEDSVDAFPAGRIENREVSRWFSIDWVGWKIVEWDFDSDSLGSWLGNGKLEGNLRIFAIQLQHVPGAAQFGALYVDELQLVGQDVTTSAEAPPENLPRKIVLHQNFPNPFNPSTTIKYELPSDEYVVLRLYDILGREVLTLVGGEKKAGYHEVTLEAARLPTGVYFYRMNSGNFNTTRKLLVVD